MLKFVASAVLWGSIISGLNAQQTALDKALNRSVTVHFHQVNVAAVMDFLATNGINVAARTSDINLKETIALNVTDERMQDVMVAVSEALGARWKRSGNIFVLTRPAPAPDVEVVGHLARRHKSEDDEEASDPQAAFEQLAGTPSAEVSIDEPSVGIHTLSSTKRTSLLRMTPSGDWAVAEQWSSSSSVGAHFLRPRLSVGQKKLLSRQGYLSVRDLTAKQVSSLGSEWPDGRYHAVSSGRTLLIRP